MSTRSKPTGKLIALATLGGLAAASLGIWMYGDGVDGFRAATRFTVRWSFLWFVVGWSASALARLWPGGWRGVLLYNRRGVGLGFAAAHFVHALFFATAILGYGAPTHLTTVIGGGFGYVLVALMAITSNDYWVRTLTPARWKALHTFGASLIAFIFAFTYYGALRKEPAIAAPSLALLGGVFVLRAAAWLKARQPRPA